MTSKINIHFLKMLLERLMHRCSPYFLPIYGFICILPHHSTSIVFTKSLVTPEVLHLMNTFQS